MAMDKMDIWVYAHWVGMPEPKLIGVLSTHYGKGGKAFGFQYAAGWIDSNEQLLLDPDIGWFSGPQFPQGKENFGMFLDSMPDRWGRTLMKRRAARDARLEGKPIPNLYDIDFLLGVFDECRMGALRFKRDPEGPFLDNNRLYSVPHWSSIRDLQYAANIVESDSDDKDLNKWLALLVAPGSSLGGARPKANILDNQGHLWIAKFPSKNDEFDKGAWEFLTYQLAQKAGIPMAESKIQKIGGNHHTFFTRRFDRANGERIHFASAMTMTGQNEDTIKEKTPSYLDIAEFIQFSGTAVQKNLSQLWRRIVFNISVSNTDDHLRNHGFLLTPKGWVLSPAYDINLSADKAGLSLNINSQDNALDFELARSVGEYFQLTAPQMDEILAEVCSAVSQWRKLAAAIGIPRAEQELMEGAFRY